MSTLEFATRILGILDVLRVVKNLSLQEQRVNELPWELDEAVDEAIDLLREMHEELMEHHDVSLECVVDKATGKRERAFEFLGEHRPRLKRLKYEIKDVRSGEGVKSMDLTLKGGEEATQANIDAEWAEALEDVANLAKVSAQEIEYRFGEETEIEAQRIEDMKECLDLRRMAFPASHKPPRVAAPAPAGAPAPAAAPVPAAAPAWAARAARRWSWRTRASWRARGRCSRCRRAGRRRRRP